MNWPGKKVVVTGGAGMVGYELVDLLQRAGARVFVLDDFSRGQNFVDGAEYQRGDAGAFADCAAAFDGARVVFNLAAYVAGVQYNAEHPAEMFERNIRLQTMPVYTAMQLGIPHFVQVSSVCVYAEQYQNPCIEPAGHLGEPNPANAGYAWAKRMGERVLAWSSIAHKVVVRPGNMYGPRDYIGERAHVIPALMHKCLHDEVIQVRGTGRELREFLYARDGARGMMAALDGEDGCYNIGTNGETAVPIDQLVTLIQEACGTDKPVAFAGSESAVQNRGDRVRWVRADKLRALGWKHEIGLKEGLRACRLALAHSA